MQKEIIQDSENYANANYSNVTFNLRVFSFVKGKNSRLMRSPCCLCECVPPFQLLNKFTDFHKILYKRHIIAGHLGLVHSISDKK